MNVAPKPKSNRRHRRKAKNLQPTTEPNGNPQSIGNPQLNDNRQPIGNAHPNGRPSEDLSEMVPMRNLFPDYSLLTQTVALDCEQVQCRQTMHLARVSLVNDRNEIIADLYVRPEEPITKYHTHIHGIGPQHMSIAIEHREAVDMMADVLTGCLIVGHSIDCDLRALFGRDRHLWPKPLHTFDIATSRTLCRRVLVLDRNGQPKRPSLREFAQHLLGRTIQAGVHSSVEDAQVAMDVYAVFKRTEAAERGDN